MEIELEEATLKSRHACEKVGTMAIKELHFRSTINHSPII